LDNPFKKEDVQILLSTMNRNSLDFLIPMFPFTHFSNFSILIINQTKVNKDLVSQFPNVKIINSYEIGLSKSRNTGLKNATGKIVLFADDDVVFKENFDGKLVQAYNKYPDSVVIVFEIENEQGGKYRKYPTKEMPLTSYFQFFNCLSIEISVNKKVFDKLNASFDANFGLGSEFQMGEEAIFLIDLYRKNKQIHFYPEAIVVHPLMSTDDKLDFVMRYYIQGAFLTRVFDFGFYFQLAMKLFFDIKQKRIRFKQVPPAMSKALEGKKKYSDYKNERRT
jgi:glycosyltransferase involved in cell wall biosynthesis